MRGWRRRKKEEKEEREEKEEKAEKEARKMRRIKPPEQTRKIIFNCELVLERRKAD